MLKLRGKHIARIGSLVGGFKRTRVEKIEDFDLTFNHYVHEKTKAQLVHLQANDQNNLFTVIFNSSVSNSRGTPHVLEHLMTCGSEKFPVRDPFMAMVKRSLNTYMNAWTGSDFIAFPFSSQNQKDFMNLLSVYLNLVYKPQLNKLDFLQEGWRLEFEKNNELVFKGVVFNEMKGVYQSAESVFNQHLMRYLLNGTKYQHSSGGHPSSIPELSYEELVQFYKQTFDPSNSLFLLYGNFDLKEIAHKIEEYMVSKQTYKAPENVKAMPLTPTSPLALPSQGGQLDQNYFSLSFQLTKPALQNQLFSIAFQILSYVLFQPQTGVLYKTILEAGLAENFFSGKGLDSYGVNSNFHFAFQGVKADKMDTIVQTITEVLTDLAENGVPQNMVDAALHQIELSLKMPTANQGMRVLWQVLNQYVCGFELLEGLKVSGTIAELKKKIGERYLEQLIKEEFLNNQSRVKIVGKPEEDFLLKIVKNEEKTLGQLKQSLSPRETEEIKEVQKQLEQHQTRKQDFSVLPDLELSDIKLEREKTHFHVTTHHGVPIKTSCQSTNGMVFVKLRFDLGKVTLSQRQYLQFFCDFFNKMGTSNINYDEMSELFNLHTTCLDVTYDSYIDTEKDNEVRSFLQFSISCLNNNLDKMLDLVLQLSSDLKLNDVRHFATILRNQSVYLQNHIFEDTLSYASNSANSTLSEASFLTDVNFSTKFILNVGKHYEKADGYTRGLYLDDFGYQMTSLLNNMFNKHRMVVLVHAEEKALQEVQQKMTGFVDNVRHKFQGFDLQLSDNYENPADKFKPSYMKKAILLQSQVNFVVQSVRVPNYSHEHTSKLQVLAQYLSNTSLHSEIREKGGAYGAGCTLNSMKGTMSMWSYRDPNILRTFNTYQALKLPKIRQKQVTHVNFSDQELKEAKMSIFQRLDKPVKPQDKGVKEEIYGIVEFKPSFRPEARNHIEATRGYFECEIE